MELEAVWKERLRLVEAVFGSAVGLGRGALSEEEDAVFYDVKYSACPGPPPNSGLLVRTGPMDQ